MKYPVYIICILLWLYILYVLKCCKLNAWYFFVGSVGLFIVMMVFLRPVLTEPLARIVAAIAGIAGKLSGMFTAYFKYGIIFIDSMNATITLQIDLECSGILEIMAFLALLAFFKVYSIAERFFVGALGVIAIILANALRIIVICFMIALGGVNVYYVAHGIVGRLVFYVATVLLYFYVFTKPQIIRTKVGKFFYGHNE